MQTPDEIFAEGIVPQQAQIPENPVSLPKVTQLKLPTSRSIFSHPEAHPVALDVILLKNFELEWLSWLPETLFSEIEQTFKTSIADINRVKILAVQTLHVTDAYWESWEIFEKTIWSLNGVTPHVKVVQPPDLSILFAGVDIANGVRKEKYGEEVARYCAAVFMNENVQYAPEPLDFCQMYVALPYYICKDCDKHGSALPPFDGLCSSCAEHYETAHPFSMRPDKEALDDGRGKNITVNLTFDPDPIKARFEELDSLPSDKLLSNIKEAENDIQAAKLIIAKDYMKFKDTQLAEQLKNLKSWLEEP